MAASTENINKVIDELTNLLTKIKEPRVQYEVRSHYLAIVKMCLEDGIRWPLYDFWRLFLPHRDLVNRGFIFDLCDILILEVNNIPESQNEIDSKQKILPSETIKLISAYACFIIPDFAEILSYKTADGMLFWIKAVADNIRRATLGSALTSGIFTSDLDCRSLMRLTCSLYPEKINEWLKLLEAQINHFCNKRTKLNDSPLFSTNIFNIMTEAHSLSDESEIMTKMLILINEFAEKCDKPDIFCLATNISLMIIDANIDSLIPLIKYWGTENLFFRRLLKDKLNFEYLNFNSLQSWDNQTIVTSLTQQVMVIGPKDAGKSSLMMATRELTKNWVTQDKQKDSNKTSLRLYRRNELIGTTEIDALETRWQSGDKVVTEGWEIYAETPTINFCRFSFDDIPGEQVTGVDSVDLTILGQQLKLKKPAALVVLLDLNSDNEINTKIFDLLERVVNDIDASTVKRIPVYILFNKADKLIKNLGTSNKTTSSLMNTLLNGLQAMDIDGNNNNKTITMFSLKNYIQPPQALDINDILNVISNSNVYCRDPVYQSRLLNDIRMLEPLVEKILQNKFFNLTFLYTVCVPVEDFTNNEKLSSKSFIGLMNMWDDLRQQITASTVVARKSFFNDAFNRRLLSQTKIVEHFRQVCNSLSNPEETPIDNFFIKPDLIDHKFFLNNDNDHAKLASFQTRNENLNRTLKYLELVTQEILIQLGIPCMNTFSEINGWDTQFLMNKDDVDPGLIQDAIKNKRIALNKIRINSYNMKENDDLISNLKDLLNSESFTLQYGTSARIDILSCIERVTSLKTYQAFRYHHLIGSLDTGCLWRDTDYTDNMDDFIHYIWEHKNEQFIERLMTDQLTNTSVNIDFLLNIIKVFANYDSSFPQFFFKFFEVNRTKYRVLSEVDSSKFSYQEFTKTQTYLYDMLACINSIIKLINNPEETNLYFKLLSKMLANQLRNQQFMFEKFVDPKTSDSFLQSLNKVANILDIYEKATSNIDMEELQRYMDEISLSGDGIHLSHTTHKLSELQKKYSEASVNFRLLKRFMQDKIINLNDIDSYNVPEMPINANIQKLTDIADMYTVDMTKILIKERSQYLIQSGWLDSIDEHFTLFAKDALEMRINLECDAREYAQSLTGILGKFIEGIELISNNDANWNFKA